MSTKNESGMRGSGDASSTDKREMRTADCVPVGMAFVGTIWRDEFSAILNKQGHLRSGKRYREFPGELIRVAMVLPAMTEDGTNEIMKTMQALPHESSLQISSDLAMWICGVREKRSNKVRIFNWGARKIQPEKGGV